MNKLFDYKRKYIASDGDVYVNMGINAYDREKLRPITVTGLNQDHSARIDTVTYNNLNDFDDIDLVMYINHIFNPFAINEGDVIYIPKSDDFYYTEREPILVDGTRHSDTNKSGKKMTYAENVEYLAKLGLGIK